MRALVTGGAGFIGSHLVDMLLSMGHDVAVLDDYSTGNLANLKAHARELDNRRWFYQGSVTNARDVEKVMALAPDAVFHLAAQIDVRESVANPIADARTNVLGTLRMLEASAAAGVRRFVYASSAATFGDTIGPVPARPSGHGVAPISPYGASKAAGELYVNLYDHMGVSGYHNMCTAVVVFPNVYGPRQRTGAVSTFTRALLKGEPVTLYGYGQNVRDYLYVFDAARSLIWAAGLLPGQQGGHSGRTLVGTGVGTTDEELFCRVRDEVARQVGGNGPLMKAGRAAARPCDIRTMVFPRSEAARTTLDDGLRLTVQAIREELGL